MDHLFVKDVRKCTGVGKHYKNSSRKHISRDVPMRGGGLKKYHQQFSFKASDWLEFPLACNCSMKKD